MRIRARNVTVLSAVLAASFVVPGATDAADVKVYSGAECMVDPSFQNEMILGNYGYQTFSVPAGSRRRFLCPIVRDNTANTNGVVSATLSGAEISTASVSCTLFSYNTSGTSVDSVTANSPGPTPADFTLNFAGLDVSTVDGFYLIRCDLPNVATISHYRIDE